ncbi:MAG: hypothetical protein WA941_23500 [Nitrososphaeraceae archaeon]
MEQAGKEIAVRLSSLEIFFIFTTLVSLAFNLYQFLQCRKIETQLRLPIYNSLVGLFMDIKTKINNAYLKQQYVANPHNPHTDINTIKWEYQLFALDVANSMQGFQEVLAGILTTLKPEDTRGEKVIRASEFGLTETEIETRRLVAERQLRALRAQEPQTASRTDDSTRD